MQPEAITTTAPNPRSARRIAKDRRACTVHVPTAHYLHLARLALERNDGRGTLQYGDLLRDAIAEYVARNPLGSPARSMPALPPTPIERFAARGNAASNAMRELEDAGFFVHGRATLADSRSLCGLAGLGDAALTSAPDAVTCRNCAGILERNAAALERASSSSSKPKSRPARKGAKKSGRR